MVSTITTISCIKHVNIMYQHVNEEMLDGVVNIIIEQSAEYDSIVFTKNLSVVFTRNIKKDDWCEA